MHRQILGEHHECIDHKDGDCLNNTKINLRPCTFSQNMWNCGHNVRNKSGLRGVRYCPKKKLWGALISTEIGRLRSPWFHTKEDAALYRDRLARQHHGEFACLSFPDVTDYSGLDERVAYTEKKSQFRGIRWLKQTRKWLAYVYIDKVLTRIGYFDDEEEAARAYDSYAKQHHGRWTKLNFLEESQ